MDLLEVLEVGHDRLPRRTARAVAYLQRAWEQAGQPTKPEALTDFLDSRLRFCTQQELQYPKVFLLRLKQLQRSEWFPRGSE
jgi:hypothetical protein